MTVGMRLCLSLDETASFISGTDEVERIHVDEDNLSVAFFCMFEIELS